MRRKTLNTLLGRKLGMCVQGPEQNIIMVGESVRRNMRQGRPFVQGGSVPVLNKVRPGWPPHADMVQGWLPLNATGCCAACAD